MSLVRDNVENWRDLPQPPSLETGTSMIVIQASAPTGWVLNTSMNNRVIRLVDNTGVGGTTGGSHNPILMDVIPSHGHTGTADTSGDHTHTIPITVNASGTRTMAFGGESITNSNEATSSSGAHTHTVTVNDNTGTNWEPRYVDAIVVTRI